MPQTGRVRPLRVFVASAAELLTDGDQHGEGLIAWQTFSALAARGHELVVCARRVDVGAASPFETVETGHRSRWESLEPLAYARHVRRIFDERGGADAFDAVHWLFPQEPLCFVPPRGINFVVGPRLTSWPVEPTARRARRAGDLVREAASPVFRALRSAAFARASRVLVSTPRAIDELPEGVRGNAEVRPFGVDLALFPVTPLPKAPTVLFVGRLDPIKRVRELIQAFAIVRDRVPAARLVLAGDGPERARIVADCHRLDVAGSVELLGRVPHGDIPDLLGRSTLLCLPSIGEPFGMVVLEAMAASRAVVAVAGGGPDVLVEDGRGGALASSGSPEALSVALLQALEQAESMGAFSRRRVGAEFSLEQVAESLERAYRRAPSAAPFSPRAEPLETAR